MIEFEVLGGQSVAVNPDHVTLVMQRCIPDTPVATYITTLKGEILVAGSFWETINRLADQ